MTTKTRIPIPSDESSNVLFASDRTCCKCNVAGKAIQIHHIDENPANNDAMNLAVLCLECHNETQISGGFGRKLSPGEVTRYRDAWLLRVRKRRDDADSLAAAAMSTVPSIHSGEAERPPSVSWAPPSTPLDIPNRAGLAEYIQVLPALRRRAYVMMHARQPSTTLETVEAYGALIALLENALTTLISYYPSAHFSNEGPEHYVSAVVADRTHWHYLRTSDQGVGQSGALIQVLTAIGVTRELERMIEDTVSTLTGEEMRYPDEAETAWHRAWREDVQITTGA